MILYQFWFCENNVREQDWRCRKRGDLAGVTRVRQRHSFVGLVILLVFDFCDNSMREKDWRCRARVTTARSPSFERMHAL